MILFVRTSRRESLSRVESHSSAAPILFPIHERKASTSRMRLALYGGTFDPIHHGHLILARDAIEQLGADRLIFIPAAISPHKLNRIPSSPELRREMLAAAIAGEPRFSLD